MNIEVLIPYYGSVTWYYFLCGKMIMSHIKISESENNKYDLHIPEKCENMYRFKGRILHQIESNFPSGTRIKTVIISNPHEIKRIERMQHEIEKILG